MTNKRSNSPILFISAGLINAKKEGNPFSQFHSYLNYGLLGLASILYRKGYNAKVYHGRFHEPISFSEFVIKHSNFIPDFPLFLSLPSLFAVEWANKFIFKFKSHFPNSKIIVGGRWVVENKGNWIRSILPNVDLVVYGTAEIRIESLLTPRNWSSIYNTDISTVQIPEAHISEYPSYVFELMYDFKDFQPSIEVSRGCGLGCSFCLEKNYPLNKLKSAKNILKEVKLINSSYQTNQISPYFEASFFKPSLKWAKQLVSEYESGGVSFNWRAETRVDSISEEVLFLLANAGLKVLDIGLESASIGQLKKMNKTHRPEIYLEKASKFLKDCKSYGIWAKINILLYAGETVETINETISWIEKHRAYIKGVSVNPLIVYGGNEDIQLYLNHLKQFGAEPIDSDFQTKGFTRMNLSKDISYEVSEKYRIQISKLFMTHNDYYDLKSFSYFPNSFTRKEFTDICLESDIAYLPFDFSMHQ